MSSNKLLKQKKKINDPNKLYKKNKKKDNYPKPKDLAKNDEHDYCNVRLEESSPTTTNYNIIIK